MSRLNGCCSELFIRLTASIVIWSVFAVGYMTITNATCTGALCMYLAAVLMMAVWMISIKVFLGTKKNPCPFYPTPLDEFIRYALVLDIMIQAVFIAVFFVFFQVKNSEMIFYTVLIYGYAVRSAAVIIGVSLLSRQDRYMTGEVIDENGSFL